MMAIRTGLLGIVLFKGTLCALAIEFVPDDTTRSVFGGGERTIKAQFHNPEVQTVKPSLRFRIYQASASTLMPLREAQVWKSLTIAPNQTVLETINVEIPEVRGITRFQIVWYDGDRKLGATIITAFPMDILMQLEALAGAKPVGLLDPEGHLKSTLLAIRTHELKEAEDVMSADTQLILVAPITAQNRPVGLTAALKRKASDGCAIVWIQPATFRQLDPLPDAYVVVEGNGKIVVATATTIAKISDSPQSQLNLIQLAELAMGKKQLELPHNP